NQGLGVGQVPEAGVHAAAHLLLCYEDLGLWGLGILQDILERRALVRDRRLYLGDGLDGDQELFDFLQRPAEGRTEVLGTRRAALAFPQPGRCSVELALTLDHVTRQPDRVVLLTEGPPS